MIFRRGNINDWSQARELLKPAFCGVFQVDDIDDFELPIRLGVAHLWIAEDENMKGAVVTMLDEGKNGKVLQVRYLGGSRLRKWALLMEDSLTKFAQENNCKQIEGWTRKGFSKLIKSFKPQGLELYVKVI